MTTKVKNEKASFVRVCVARVQRRKHTNNAHVAKLISCPKGDDP